jgi:lysyl-tRNA synthetase class 1
MNEQNANLSWPFREAERVAERLKEKGKTAALFETGYGPSGLPHIGTSARWRGPAGSGAPLPS